MAGGITAAIIVGGATAYSANKQSKAMEEAAKGSKVTPWGPTGPYMEELLGGAMDRFRAGQFQFGTSPDLYNAYLGFGRKDLGLSLPKRLNIGPGEVKGYGPGAYEYMLGLMEGPAFAGATRSNPGALVGAPNPWVAGLMGGLGAYTTVAGMGGGSSSIPAITDSGPVAGVQYPTRQVTVNPSDIIYGAR